MPGTPELAIILALVVSAIGVVIWIYKSGGDKIKKKVAQQEIKDRDEFVKRGEEWDGMGGLGGIVRRRLRRK